MVDKAISEKAKKYANLYKDILINDGAEAYEKRKKQDLDYGLITISEMTLATMLTGLYVDVVQGKLSRQEALQRQRNLFALLVIV
mgnify:CR=1 FL=1